MKFASVSVAVLALAVLCQGQTQPTQPKTKGQLPPGWKALNLTPKQTTDVYAVRNAYKGKIKALDDQIKALKTEEHAEMVKLLTADQKAQLAKGLVPEAKPETKPDDKK